jgi:hypothetical protein
MPRRTAPSPFTQAYAACFDTPTARANASGDQVVVRADGSMRLVAKAEFTWPEPRCGGDPIPLFGGTECNPDDFEQQLQSHDLDGAMVDVMGAIGQGRMCEFWSTMLPPNVEAEHPWTSSRMSGAPGS